VSVGRHEPTDCVIPEVVSLIVEPAGASASAPDGPGTEDTGSLVPQDRNGDVELFAGGDGDDFTASVRIEPSAMTDAEQRYYAGLPDGELGDILADVMGIVSTAQPGRADAATQELLEKLAAGSGFGSPEDGRFYPIYFEGHRDVGFPVRVSVAIPEGELEGGRDLWVYHIAEDGSIEPLGQADIWTYPDGSVERISFLTGGFSTFFTAGTELDIGSPGEYIETPGALEPAAEKTSPLPAILIAAACLIVIAVVLTFVLKKRRRA
jgi:hypothetical protein